MTILQVIYSTWETNISSLRGKGRVFFILKSGIHSSLTSLSFNDFQGPFVFWREKTDFRVYSWMIEKNFLLGSQLPMFNPYPNYSPFPFHWDLPCLKSPSSTPATKRTAVTVTLGLEDIVIQTFFRIPNPQPGLWAELEKLRFVESG